MYKVVALLIIYQIVILVVSLNNKDEKGMKFHNFFNLFFLFAIALLWCFPIAFYKNIAINIATLFYFIISYAYIFFQKNIYLRSLKYSFCVIFLLCWSVLFSHLQNSFYGQFGFIAILIIINLLIFDDKQDLFINCGLTPFLCYYCTIAFNLASSFDFANLLGIMLITLFVSNFLYDLFGYKQSNCFTCKLI